MIEPKLIGLTFAPTNELVEGQIVTLDDGLLDDMEANWWTDPDLINPLPAQIDRYWNWREYPPPDPEGRPLAVETVALVAGGLVQGAMMISSEPVDSALSPGEKALFIELLFTAPRNRPNCREDGGALLLGVGTELLTWGAWFSQSKGFAGRILLDGSPDFVRWYGKRGLKTLDREPIVVENVSYTPMELPAEAASNLLAKWKE
jgi:hypothetical protein